VFRSVFIRSLLGVLVISKILLLLIVSPQYRDGILKHVTTTSLQLTKIHLVVCNIIIIIVIVIINCYDRPG
jgi:hypothetical protein